MFPQGWKAARPISTHCHSSKVGFHGHDTALTVAVLPYEQQLAQMHAADFLKMGQEGAGSSVTVFVAVGIHRSR